MKKKQPRFSSGEVVYHGPDKAKVLDLISDPSEPEARYYVQHSGWVWSAPESALSLLKPKN